MTWTRKSKPIVELRLNSLRYTAMNYTEPGFIDRYDTNPPYQRGSVWTLDQRRDLIFSLLSGIPIGAVIVNQRSYSTEENIRVFGTPHIYAIIDGKQRVETLVAFARGEFSILADWLSDEEFDIDSGTVRDNGRVRWGDLTSLGRRRFEMFPVPTEVAQVRSLRAEAAIFRLVNTTGTDQTEDDIARAEGIERGAA